MQSIDFSLTENFRRGGVVTSHPYFVATNQQRSPAEFCAEDLGLESGSLGDEALTASSSYDPANVGPTNARWGS